MQQGLRARQLLHLSLALWECCFGDFVARSVELNCATRRWISARLEASQKLSTARSRCSCATRDTTVCCPTFAATLAIRNGSKESCSACLRIEILDDVQQFGLDVPGHADHLNSTLRRPQHECGLRFQTGMSTNGWARTSHNMTAVDLLGELSLRWAPFNEMRQVPIGAHAQI